MLMKFVKLTITSRLEQENFTVLEGLEIFHSKIFALKIQIHECRDVYNYLRKEKNVKQF